MDRVAKSNEYVQDIIKNDEHPLLSLRQLVECVLNELGKRTDSQYAKEEVKKITDMSLAVERSFIIKEYPQHFSTCSAEGGCCCSCHQRILTAP